MKEKELLHIIKQADKSEATRLGLGGAQLSELPPEIANLKKLTNENVKFFCKLPRWFLVPTPLGNYNPDWAVVTEKDEKIYLVRETKSTHDRDQRRGFENRKIDCGQAHFDTLGVNFKVATNIHEVLA